MGSSFASGAHVAVGVLVGFLFAFGPSVSAFDQQTPTPAPLPRPPTAPTTAPATTPATAPAGPVRQLSVDEAVRQALEHNLNLQVERLNPRIQDLSVAQARTVYVPNLSTGFSVNSQSNPPSSFLSGGASTVTSDRFSTDAQINQLLPFGGSYAVSWDSFRSTSNSFFSNFNPTLQSNMNFSFVQPMLRNFSIDSARLQLLVSKKNREISDIELRDTVVNTVRNVKNSYWNLVYARSALAVQHQSLDLARESLKNNRTRVEVGTMAPIDIVEAEAEVARNDEAVILAEAAVTQAEDALRALIMDPSTPDFWTVTIEPTDPPQTEMRPVDIEAAVRNSLAQRTDIQRARRTLETSDINMRYFKNQTLPDINLNLNYGLVGVAGTQFEPFRGLPTGGTTTRAVVGRRGVGSALGDIFGNNYPTWTLGLSVGYPIGQSASEANFARARLQYTQSQTQIKSLELQVATQVRSLGRQVNTSVKRVEATRASRQLAERRLEAEQKKFGVGMSTSFFVFQAQRDLAQARNAELRAVLDYNQSLVDFEAGQEAGGGAGITVVSGSTGGGGALPAGNAAGGGGQGTQRQGQGQNRPR